MRRERGQPERTQDKRAEQACLPQLLGARARFDHYLERHAVCRPTGTPLLQPTCQQLPHFFHGLALHAGPRSKQNLHDKRRLSGVSFTVNGVSSSPICPTSTRELDISVRLVHADNFQLVAGPRQCLRQITT